MDTHNDNIANLNILINTLFDEISSGNLASSTAVEKEKTLSYWTIGNLIHAHLSFHNHERNYARSLYSTLSKKLNISKRNLLYAVQLYSTYPNKDDIDFTISWSHFCLLVTVNPVEKRQEFEELVRKENLTIKQLQNIIKEYKLEILQNNNINLTRKPGLLYHYKIQISDDKPVIDLGFYARHKRFPGYQTLDHGAAMVKVNRSEDSHLVEPIAFDKSLLYTYKAKVLHVIDGDTIHVEVDLGFDMAILVKIRLRGINAPDLITDEGRRAKDFVLDTLDGIDFVIIKTHHRDSFARYVADVYYDPEHVDPVMIMSKGHFLNQELLDNKLATPYLKY